MTHSRNRRPRRARRGVVLVIVVMVVALLSFSAYAFSDLMLTHYEAAQYSGRQVQARALVDSGVDMLRWYLSQDETARQDGGGIFNNPMMFSGAVVVPSEDPEERGCFSILAPNLDSQGNLAGVRYGLEDESARLNLNFLIPAEGLLEGAGRDLLMALPGMTPEVADAILDWMDEDLEPREFGAEAEYYSSLDPPYAPTNGNLQTVEELLLVRGITPELLFGFDTNRNGMVDPHEQQAYQVGPTAAATGPTASPSIDPTAGDMTRGWAAYLTLYSMEKNANSLGEPRIDLNSADLQTLSAELSAIFQPAEVTFILAYRLSGAYSGSEEGEPASSGELDLTQEPRGQLSQVLDLVGAKVEVKFQNSEETVVMQSPFTADLVAMNTYLAVLMDSCTVNSAGTIPGRININQAPRSVLLGIPGITEELVDQIISLRGDPSEQSDESAESATRNETWLLTEGLLLTEDGQPDVAKMKQLMPFLTTGGSVYRAQVVGYFQGRGGSSRVEVIIDTTGTTPSVRMWRDLSHLGRGFSLDVLGLNLSSL